MNYKYNVFISYASEDSAWAKRLRSSLIGAGLTVFLDKDELKPGILWEAQLKEGMKQSQHLIVLWSNHAANRSSWVAKEKIWFEFADNAGKRQINIVLEDVLEQPENGLPQARLDGSIQNIFTIKENNIYHQEDAANTIDRQLWEGILNEIVRALEVKDLRDPIYRIWITLTLAEFDEINFDQPVIDGESINNVLKRIGYNRNMLRQQYGNLRSDWKPFGENNNVLIVTDTILDSINEKYKLRFRWLSIEEHLFWQGSKAEAVDQINRVTSDQSLIIIDPIALFHWRVKQRFGWLTSQCFKNKNALFIAFSLLALPDQYLLSRRLLEFGDNDFHEKYFLPSIPKRDITDALIAANPVDPGEASRFIQYLISQTYSKGSSGEDIKAIFGH